MHNVLAMSAQGRPIDDGGDDGYGRFAEQDAPQRDLSTLFGSKHDLVGLRGRVIPPTKWLVRGWLTSVGLTIMYSDEGLGKSLKAMHICLEICNPEPGRALLGGTVDNVGRVFYAAGEGTGSDHMIRAQDIQRNNMEGVDVDAAASRLRLFSYVDANEDDFPFDDRILFTKNNATGKVTPTLHMLALVDMLERHNASAAPGDRFVLLVIDTVAGMLGIDLMDDGGINQAFYWLNRKMTALGISCLMIAHTNKAGASNDPDNARAALKGSQQVGAAVTQTIYMRAAMDVEYCDVLADGLAKGAEEVIAMRIGKTNMKDPYRGTRILTKIGAGAPIDVTEKISDGSVDVRRGLIHAMQVVQADNGDFVFTANNVQTLAKQDRWHVRFPSLKSIPQNGTVPTKDGTRKQKHGSAAWHLADMLTRGMVLAVKGKTAGFRLSDTMMASEEYL